MIIVLLDTNVVLDYVLHRDKFEDAEKVISLAKNDDGNGDIECVTTTTITDIQYEVAKYKEAGSETKKYTSLEAQDLLSDFIKYIEILGVNSKHIKNALSLRWKDFEDAVQYSVAVDNGINCIITNNIKDFKDSEIPVYTPADFIEQRETFIASIESSSQTEFGTTDTHMTTQQALDTFGDGKRKSSSNNMSDRKHQ